MINDSQFFEWMVHHHINTNLPKCLPHLEGESMATRVGSPRHTENKHYDGAVFVADGEGLIERMIEDGTAWGVGSRHVSIKDAAGLSDYLNGLSNPDGGHIYDSSRRVGTRGLIAIEIPLVYPEAHVFQIKQTRYGELGVGKVIHTNEHGLVEEFFFVPSGSELQDTLDPRNTIQGIYRKYVGTREGPVRVTEELRKIHPVYTPVPL